MEIKTETRTVSIALRLWRGGWNAGYKPDCFADLENGSFAREFGKGLDEEIGAILATDADLDNLIDWWQSECDAANSGEDGEVLLALSDEERERGDEWNLIVD